MQYMPMPPAPKAPSPLTDPKALSDKLPTVALIVLCGYGVYALYRLINGIVSAVQSYSGGVSWVFDGLFGAIFTLTQGIVFFAILMGIKHIIDMKQAKVDAAAKADA